MAGRPQLVKDHALAAAVLAAVGQVGPHAVTFALVAERCGISPAAVAQRFGSRRSMLLESARRAGQTLTQDLLAIEHPTGATPIEAVDAVLQVLTRDMTDAAAVAHHTEFMVMDMQDDDFRAEARHTLGSIGEAVHRALVVTRVPGAVLERGPAIVAAIHGTMLQWAIHRTSTLHDTLRTTIEPMLR